MNDTDVAELAAHWQRHHLLDKCADLDPYQRSDVIRRQLEQVEWSRSSQVLSHNAATPLFLTYGERYASSVDSQIAVGGVNNFAEGALALQAGKRNESKLWTTSLNKERLKSLPFVQKFLETCKIASCAVVPPGMENSPMHLSNTDPKRPPENQPQQRLENGSKSGSYPKYSSGIVSTTRISATKLPGRESSHDFRANSFTAPMRNLGPQNAATGEPEGRNGCQPPAGSFGSRKPLFSEKNEKVNPYAAYASANSAMPRYKKPEPMKRPYREVENEEPEEDGAVFNAFKTAREQLVIDNQKKSNRGRAGSSGGSVGAAAYGTSKKSLGTRRGLSNKFVPPVANREDDDDDGGSLVHKAGPGGSSRKNGNNDPEEPVDERLKNIDPKMVELITNEIMDHGPPMTWDDIAGLEFAKKTIKEIVVWPMLRPDIFTGLRGPPKGLLLFGPPGTGKTLIGKCIACQSKSTFFSISASSLTSKWVGEGEKMVRALFAVGRVHQPAVVFIDEIDSLLSKRSDSEHESSRKIKTEFLVQLDGATTSSEERILVVGATNRPQEIDEAARRRFVKRLYIPLPETEARQQIVRNLMSQQSHQLTGHDVEDIGQKTDGYSGADMANLCREAALGPIRSISLDEIENISADQVRPILPVDFEKALPQVKASVSLQDLDVYLEWNKQYGSWEL